MKQRPEEDMKELTKEEKDQKIEELEQKLKLAEHRIEQLKKLRDYERADAEPYPGSQGDSLL